MTMTQLTMFFGWCTLLNYALLVISTFFIIVAKDWIVSIHKKMFSLSNDELNKSYFNYLARYKILIFIFNFVPWLALKFMS